MCSMTSSRLVLDLSLARPPDIKLSVFEDVEPPLAMDQVVSLVPHGFVFVCRMTQFCMPVLVKFLFDKKSLRKLLGKYFVPAVTINRTASASLPLHLATSSIAAAVARPNASIIAPKGSLVGLQFTAA